jgi:hypothetical protein
VQLPQADVIGVQQREGFFDHAERAVVGALFCFCGEEGFIAACFHDAADVLLAPALGTAIDGIGVDVIDPEVEGALDDGNSDIEIYFAFRAQPDRRG